MYLKASSLTVSNSFTAANATFALNAAACTFRDRPIPDPAPLILPVWTPNGGERTGENPEIEFCCRQATSVRQIGTYGQMPYTQARTEFNRSAFRYFSEDGQNRNVGVSATAATFERAVSLSARHATEASRGSMNDFVGKPFGKTSSQHT